MLYDSGTERPARISHTPQIKQELTIFVSHGVPACGSTPGKSAQDQAVHLAEPDHEW
ncbi:MAG: hypothetical protein ACRDUV_18595 [Pseudonocardiaceae bacterium]